MTTHKGSVLVTALIVVAGLLVLGGGAYVVLNPDAVKAPAAAVEEGTEAQAETERKGKDKWIEVDSSTSISWKLTTLPERDHIPYTNVAVVIDGTTYPVGDFQGSCTELGANGGIDGKGLVAGELSAMQCYFAGAGDEIGVFAHEDGGYQIMVGALEEPIEGGAGFRGDFKIRTDIYP